MDCKNAFGPQSIDGGKVTFSVDDLAPRRAHSAPFSSGSAGPCSDHPKGDTLFSGAVAGEPPAGPLTYEYLQAIYQPTGGDDTAHARRSVGWGGRLPQASDFSAAPGG